MALKPATIKLEENLFEVFDPKQEIVYVVQGAQDRESEG